MEAHEIKRKRIMYLTLSTLTLLFLGLIYAFSMFAAPMCVTFGLEKADVALVQHHDDRVLRRRDHRQPAREGHRRQMEHRLVGRLVLRRFRGNRIFRP